MDQERGPRGLRKSDSAWRQWAADGPQSLEGLTDVTLEVTFGEAAYNLPAMINVLGRIDVVWTGAAQLVAYRERTDIPPRGEPRPVLRRLSMQSPLTITLAGSPMLIGTFMFVAYLLKHADDVGRWLPRVVRGWREEWDAAERAKKDRNLAKALTGDHAAQYLSQYLKNSQPQESEQPPSISDQLIAQIEYDTRELLHVATPVEVEVTGNLSMAIE